MAATDSEAATRARARRASPWRGFRTGLWQKEINVRDFIQQNYEPYDGDESFLAPRHRAHAEASGSSSTSSSSRSARRACSTSRRSRARSPRTRPGYIDRENEIIVGLQTDAPLKRAIMPNGGFRMVVSALKTYGYEPDPHVVEAFTKYRKTHNDARLRRLHRGHPALPQLAHPDRPARRLRPRPHHRRLPPRRALRRRPADRAQAAGEGRARRRDVDRRRSSATARSSPSRSARSKELQQMAASYGFDISRPGAQRAGRPSSGSTSATWPAVKEQNGAAMSLGPHLDLPRHLLRARPRGRRAHRGAGAGDHRRLRHQAAHRPLPAHAGVRRAVRRRSDLGHRVDRRHGRRRPARW